MRSPLCISYQVGYPLLKWKQLYKAKEVRGLKMQDVKNVEYVLLGKQRQHLYCKKGQ